MPHTNLYQYIFPVSDYMDFSALCSYSDMLNGIKIVLPQYWSSHGQRSPQGKDTVL